jgi:hypothetical protein
MEFVLMLNIDAGWRPPPPIRFAGQRAGADLIAAPALKRAANR